MCRHNDEPGYECDQCRRERQDAEDRNERDLEAVADEFRYQ